jgi:hypothetical protein
MDLLIKKAVKWLTISFLIIASCAGVYGYGVLLNAVSATMAKWKSEGSVLWRDISAERMDIHEIANSTDLINKLYERHRRTGLAADRNIWTVVKNLPADAPGNFIVLCTRNIDPKSLKLRLTEDEMEREIRFSDTKDRILKNYGIVIRKDGSGYIAVCANKSVSSGLSYRCVYENKSFDLLSGKDRPFTVQYLTPTGEVTIEE